MKTNHMNAPEMAAIELTGTTRAQFLTRATLAAGAVYGAGAVSPFVRTALAQDADVEILNFALTLEFLEAAFYQQAMKQVNGLGGDNAKLAKEIFENEAEHVDVLKKTIKDLGGTAAKEPKVDFGNAFSSEKSFLKLAQTLEDTGVSAYNGAGPMLKSKELLGAAGSIVQVEARHAGLIRLARGETPAPDAFDKSLSTDEVLSAVKPFIKS